ncbi:PPIC-type PPIASE domain protein [Fusarium beomiforme]|uniref:PPIC-type PPIASE domain protein n=1 Tax=Fusarium beomiforme TaxID=44412 RepID=A0A9P5ALM7_9HYPO|nr:PPIC-type PPIASE domain protein [Fusarium beomiforme]
MCLPVRYVYPDCGHPVDSDPQVWSVERCRSAVVLNRDCWTPHDILEELIEKKPWPNNNLTEPCYMPHEPQYSDFKFAVVDEPMGDVHEANSPPSATLSPGSKGHNRNLSLTKLVPNNTEEVYFLTPPETRFDMPMFLPDEAILHDLEPLSLEPHDPDDIDDIKLVDDNETNANSKSAKFKDSVVFTDEEIVFFTQMIKEAGDELAIAATEDNIEWAQVAVVDINAPIEHFGFEDSEGEDMDMVTDDMWF